MDLYDQLLEMEQSKSSLLSSEIETLRQRVRELEKIERVANCNTVDSFLSLPDADKRKWFAISVEDSTRRKHAEDELQTLRQRVASLEVVIKDFAQIEISMEAELTAQKQEWHKAYDIGVTCKHQLAALKQEMKMDAEGPDWIQRAMQAEAELYCLKQAQGEPVAWVWKDDLTEFTATRPTDEANFTKLFAVPPTVAAERAISDKLEKALNNCATADALGMCDSGHSAGYVAHATLAELAAMRKGETE